jgi:putative acetyltransferase
VAARPESQAVEIARAAPTSRAARRLLAELDAYLEPWYPAASNHGLSVEALARLEVEFLLARRAGTALGCVGFVPLARGAAEVKPLYVRPAARGAGIARALLAALEARARERGCHRLLLETGVHQPDTNALYERAAFTLRGPFAGYREDPLSRYYEKDLSSPPAAAGAL